MLKVDGQVVGRVAETIGSRIGGQDVHRLAADIDLKRRPDRLHILFSGQSTHPVLLALVAMDKEYGVNRIQPPCGSLFDPPLQHLLLFGAQGRAIFGHLIVPNRFPENATFGISGMDHRLVLGSFHGRGFLREVQASFGVERVMAFQAVIGEDRGYFLIKETLFRALNHQGSDGRVGRLASRPVVSCHLLFTERPSKKRYHVIGTLPGSVSVRLIGQAELHVGFPGLQGACILSLMIERPVDVKFELSLRAAGVDHVGQFRLDGERLGTERGNTVGIGLGGSAAHVESIPILPQGEAAFAAIA